MLAEIARFTAPHCDCCVTTLLKKPPKTTRRPWTHSSSGTAFRRLRRLLRHAAGGGGLVLRSDDALRYPARYLFVFLDHHGMLSVFGSPTWRTVTGGSANYVHAVAARLNEVFPERRCTRRSRVSDGVVLRAGGDAPRSFDAAVVAVHPDQALLLLDDLTPWEQAVLGAIPYSTNRLSCTPTNRCSPAAAARAHRGTTW